MQANNRDAASLWDMMQAIRRVQSFTAGLSFDDYQESVLIQSAVERQLEILGEAASRVSDERVWEKQRSTSASMPQIERFLLLYKRWLLLLKSVVTSAKVVFTSMLKLLITYGSNVGYFHSSGRKE